MNINPMQSFVSFGYSSVIKTLWLKGELPTVKKGIYGADLTKKNVSLEHLKAHSKGGTTTLDNLALADKTLNNQRGNKPLKDFLTFEQALSYYEQFKGIKNKHFDGDKYIKEGLETIRKLEVQ